jgi:glyoxylase-like metal-dependent hydrolase (beta-lactamase superfamily II)
MPSLFRIISLFSRSSKYEGFKPDLIIAEDFNLQSYGIYAKVIYTPGHSKGSIGVLTADGDLFCGDLLTNMNRPALNVIIDNRTTANTSIEKLKSLRVNTVYPGHGKSFTWVSF